LAREEELRRLTQQLAGQQAQTEQIEQALEAGRSALQAAEQTREETQRFYNDSNRQLSEIRSNLSGKRTRADHLRQRREQLKQEQQEVGEQIRADRQLMEETRERLHRALESMESLGSRREALVQRRDQLRDRLNQSRERLNQQRGQTHQLALQVESMRTARQSLVQNLERTQQQLRQLVQRRDELQTGLAEGEEPLRQKQLELEQQLASRVEVEKELATVRSGLEGVDLQLRELEQERHRAERQVQERRNELDQSRLQRQEVLVRSKTLEEQLRETGRDSKTLFDEMPDEANEADWQRRVEQLAARIQRLGPINLAAIDEYQEQSERLKYLDEQHADITQSLETLETAIRKIDRETRTRFKETFDKVNTGIKELFPRLFGGGHAYLELTGEDLLDTGVTVMARPPGKRNSSIHLLSGGEKALTAVALVFSIFQLNPAPFCMLDEVDAPLDDANVGRFCDMVKAMSDRVQFIFITHNKITMEIANQLSGVTMHEPGVSRLVTVDVEEAAQLAAI
jgi:chromosome segregation protein